MQTNKITTLMTFKHPTGGGEDELFRFVPRSDGRYASAAQLKLALPGQLVRVKDIYYYIEKVSKWDVRGQGCKLLVKERSA